MDKHNPTIIPRNHLVENALTEAVEKNKITKIINLLKIIENPHKAGSEISYYQSTPVNEPKYTTYCGT